MFAKILVPLDGSELAERALVQAVEMALAGSVDLLLLRVPVAEQVLVGPYSKFDTYHLEMSPLKSTREAEKYLADICDRYQNSGVSIETHIENGRPEDVIVGVAREENVDLILISSHGYSGIRKWVMGSVAKAVVAKVGCPVLILHDAHPIKKIIIALDGSEFSEIALIPGMNLAQLTGAEVIFLRIQEYINYIDDVVLEEMEASTSGMGSFSRRSVYTKVDWYLRDLEFRFVDKDVEIRSASFVADDPAQGIIDFAACQEVDCIVMGTHGRSGLSRLVYGSVTERVLSHFDRSMLIVRPPELEI